MLIRFEVTNYKNFEEPVVIDFGEVGGYQFNADCIANDTVSKLLIYGKNGTGKTNLGGAVADIALPVGNGEHFLNADSESESARFDYLFRFGGTDVQYAYSKDEDGLFLTESLYVGGAKIFDFDYANRWFWHGNLELITAETVLVERFLEGLKADVGAESLSFLRWLFANAVFPRDSVMTGLRTFVDGMSFLNVPELIAENNPISDRRFLRSMEGENLQRFEEFLNAMGVKCELENRKLPDGNNALYFKHKRLLPFFETASSGTLALYNFYSRIMTMLKGRTFVYMDSFDSSLHHVASEKFFAYLKENYPNCQIVLTSHNTHLMTNRLTRPDCICVLTPDGKLMPLNKAAGKELREGHNLEKLYISGEFE